MTNAMTEMDEVPAAAASLLGNSFTVATSKVPPNTSNTGI